MEVFQSFRSDGEKLFPLQHPTISSTIFLELFDLKRLADENETCSFNFSLWDTEPLYQMNITMNPNTGEGTLIQDSRSNSTWLSELQTAKIYDLGVLLGASGEKIAINITIIKDQFLVSVNDNLRAEDFVVNWDRLANFGWFEFAAMSKECIKLNFERSFLITHNIG